MKTIIWLIVSVVISLSIYGITREIKTDENNNPSFSFRTQDDYEILKKRFGAGSFLVTLNAEETTSDYYKAIITVSGDLKRWIEEGYAEAEVWMGDYSDVVTPDITWNDGEIVVTMEEEPPQSHDLFVKFPFDGLDFPDEFKAEISVQENRSGKLGPILNYRGVFYPEEGERQYFELVKTNILQSTVSFLGTGVGKVTALIIIFIVICAYQWFREQQFV